MSERLRELQRQRLLLQEHLAWLECEIATESAKSPAPPALPTQIKAAMPVTPPAVAADPDAILSEYRSDPRAVHRELKKGCLLYFFLAFVLLGAGVWLLYFFSFRR